MKFYEEFITYLKKDEVFVFGSNLAGRHGAGAALTAVKKFGAVYGVGVGLRGQSYAFPTKDEKIQTLPLDRIRQEAETLISFARDNADKTFFLTDVGCGLAGYSASQIAPFFKETPDNIVLPKVFWDLIQENR